jgi:Ca2+-binding RTX toxin-like protein
MGQQERALPSRNAFPPEEVGTMRKGTLFAAIALATTLVPSPAEARPPSCLGEPATIVGTRGSDVLNGSASRDIILALAGADRIRGRGGNDLICAGQGNDTVAAEGGNDEVDLGPGDDSVEPGPGDDFVNGAKGFDVVGYETTNDIRADLRIGRINGLGRDRVVDVSAISTGAGNDVLIGTDRHDDFLSNAGDDTLMGLGGNDLLGPGTGDDVVRGGRGFDQVDYFFSDDSAPVQVDLSAGAVTGHGSDTLGSVEAAGGTNSDDTLTGDAEPNALFGWGGNDVITGGDGDDFISPGLGDDSADGGGNTPVDTTASRFGDFLDHRIVDGFFAPTETPVIVDLAAGTSTGLGTDTVTGFESVGGTNGNDSITLNDDPNRSVGFAGSDTLEGLGGDDYLNGGDGSDELDGGGGTDTCINGETVIDCEA